MMRRERAAPSLALPLEGGGKRKEEDGTTLLSLPPLRGKVRKGDDAVLANDVSSAAPRSHRFRGGTRRAAAAVFAAGALALVGGVGRDRLAELLDPAHAVLVMAVGDVGRQDRRHLLGPQRIHD